MSSRPTRIGGAWLRALPVWLAAAALLPLGSVETVAERSFLTDLPPAEIEALEASRREWPLPDDPLELLDRIFVLDAAYRFDAGLALIDTDRRWFGTPPPDDPGGPRLEVRRWPGDTVLALYVLRGALPAGSDYRPPLPDAELDGPEVSEGRWRWEGSLSTPAGDRFVVWVEQAVADADHRLAALLVPGDAGLGPEAVRDLNVELSRTLDRLQPRPEVWIDLEPVAPGPVVLPDLGLPPGEWDETEDPWQIVQGLDFTLGLPPGIRSRRLFPAFPGPRPVPGGVLWLRGRFTNSIGEEVVLGDGSHGGYVAEVRPPDTAWADGKTAPRGAPEAALIAGAPFELAVERTVAVAARAERWREPGLDGEWLLFRLVFEERGIEIGLPILSGRHSEALFWIPVTWREAHQPPAPPPIDPAKRFGIRFDRLTPSDRKRNPWTEGYLNVPGLRLDLPLNWWPVASLRTDDGFPVRLLDDAGRTVGRLSRLEGDAAAGEIEPGWSPVKRPGRFNASDVYGREDGARLYVSRQGHGFLLEPAEDAPVEADIWVRLVDSVALLRAEP